MDHPKRRRTDYIVVHCSATRPSSNIGADEIDHMHRQRQFDEIGYHSVIRRDGEIEFGRHFDQQGAHVKGHNFRSVSVCMVGGINEQTGDAEDNFTEDQYDSLWDVLCVLERAYPDAQIVGHRDLSPDLDGDGIVEEHEWLKECPSFDVSDFVAAREIRV